MKIVSFTCGAGDAPMLAAANVDRSVYGWDIRPSQAEMHAPPVLLMNHAIWFTLNDTVPIALRPFFASV